MRNLIFSLIILALCASTALGLNYDQFYYQRHMGNVLSGGVTDPIYLFMQEMVGAVGGIPGTGDHWYVDSNVTSEGNGKSWIQARDTLDEAINLTTANNGDVIWIAQCSDETRAVTGAIFTADVAGITIIGCGVGDDRPKFTLSHTGATIDITADNVRLSNVYIDATGIDSVNLPINVSGEGVVIDNCWIRLGDSNGQADIGITVGLADADANDLTIAYCTFESPDVGTASAISFVFDMHNVVLGGLNIYGEFSEAGVDFVTAGNACKNVLIDGCMVTNLTASQHAVQVNGTTCTGAITNSTLEANAEDTIVDAGGLEVASSTSLVITGTGEGGAFPANMRIIDLLGDYTGPDSGAAQGNNIYADMVLAQTDLDKIIVDINDIEEAATQLDVDVNDIEDATTQLDVDVNDIEEYVVAIEVDTIQLDVDVNDIEELIVIVDTVADKIDVDVNDIEDSLLQVDVDVNDIEELVVIVDTVADKIDVDVNDIEDSLLQVDVDVNDIEELIVIVDTVVDKLDVDVNDVEDALTQLDVDVNDIEEIATNIMADSNDIYYWQAKTTKVTMTGILTPDNDLWDVAGGDILITSFVGICDVTVDANVMTLQINNDADGILDTQFSTAVACEDDVAGTVYIFSNANPAILTPLVTGTGEGATSLMMPWVCKEGMVECTSGAANLTGTISWYMTWVPLETGVTVTAQ